MKGKKILSVALACAMSISMAACGNNNNSAPASNDAAAAPAADTAAPAADTAAPAADTAEAAAPAADAAEAEAPATSGGGKVGISMPTQSLERWNRDGSYLDEKFKEAGYETSLTYADNKIDQQVKDIEGLIADGVNLLVVAAVDGEALTQVLAGAKEANIPVISYDRLIMNTDAISYYVSFDNYTVGTLQGLFVVDQLDLDNAAGPFNIEFTAGDPADNNAGYFFNGAYDVLSPYIEEGKLVVQSGQTSFDQVATPQWDTKNAMNRFQNILGSNYPNGTTLDVALCSNDSTALGVSQAIESDYWGNVEDVIITGQDGDEANLANLVDGKQTMTVYKAVANEAVATIDLGVAILSGQTPDESLIADAGWSFDCAYDTESYDNGTGIIPSYLLVPTVVTKDNMVAELVDTGYYTQDDAGYLHPAG
ncbi:MAG: sugar-binding protein [Lachnospiraceae bacterium]|nr:sugar-binding protein [Lachnospiraceae bacterium]